MSGQPLTCQNDGENLACKLQETSVDEKALVVAIDFGTTYSGIAWSFTAEFEKYPLRINSLQWSPIQGPSQSTYKTPTALLLKSNKQFLAFGYEAEEQYDELVNDNAHHGYYFFRNFKMRLYENKELRIDTTIMDEEGHKMLAKDLFRHSIKYMKTRLMEELQTRGGGMIKDENIMWVVTVPAIWSDGAKQFTREAAVLAGIPRKQIRLALEPEAASIYAKEVYLERTRATVQQQNLSFGQGTKYIVLDLGGGTIDISLKELTEENKITEIHHATGGPWGGLTVNEEFMVFLKKLVGEDVIEELKTNYKSCWLDIEREVEVKKKNTRGDKDGRILFQLPAELLEIYEGKKGKKLMNAIAFETDYAGKIDFKQNKLRLDKSIVVTFFKKCLDDIVDHTKQILAKPEANGISHLILVGGFAESDFIRKELPKALGGNLHVFIPDEPWLAIMRGAVLFGQNPRVIETRKCKFTYGTKVMRYFIDDFDDPMHKVEEDGQPFCSNVFHKLAGVGESFEVGEAVTTEVYAHKADMTKMSVRFYRSTENNPRYVTDEGCTEIGKIVVDMPGYGKERKVIVSLCFGEEEITCSGENESNETVQVMLDLLSKS